MPDETNNPIDGRLKQHAQARRADLGQPLELHPATRRLLQDEAARVHGTAGAGQPGVPWFIRYWPRLAFGGAIVGTLAFIMVKVMPTQDKMTMAMNGAQHSEGVAPPPAAAPTAAPPVAAPMAAAPAARALPTPAEPPELKDDFRQVEKLELKKSLTVTTATPPPPAPTAPTLAPDGTAGNLDQAREQPSLKAMERRFEAPRPTMRNDRAAEPSATPASTFAKDAAGTAAGGPVVAQRTADSLASESRIAPAAASQPAKPEPKPASLANTRAVAVPERQMRQAESAAANTAPKAPAPGGQAETFQFQNTSAGAGSPGQAQGTSQTQRFSQVENVRRRNFNSPPLPPVLNNFELVVSGNRVTITDADGSVYEGAVQASATESNTANDVKLKNQAEAYSVRANSTVPAVPFQVTGTNLSLNQAVQFTGNMTLPASNVGNMASRLNNLLKRQGGVAQKEAPDADPKPSGEVQGRAIIGGTQQLEIHATPSNQ